MRSPTENCTGDSGAGSVGSVPRGCVMISESSPGAWASAATKVRHALQVDRCDSTPRLADADNEPSANSAAVLSSMQRKAASVPGFVAALHRGMSGGETAAADVRILW